MRIVIVPTTGWDQTTDTVARRLGQAWRAAAPGDTVHQIALSDGSMGFAGQDADSIYVEAGALVPQTGARSITKGSSYSLGVELAKIWGATARRVVLGFDPEPGAVPWADAGAGLLAGMLDTLQVVVATTGGSAAAGTDGTVGAEGGQQDLAPGRLLDGGLGLAGMSSIDLPGLSALRAQLGRNPIVVASKAARPLLGLEGLAATLAEEGHLDQAAAHDLERAVGDFVQAVAGALGPSLLGRNLLGAGQETYGARAEADSSTRARGLAATPGTSNGGGAAFMLNVLGAQLANALEVTAERAGLDTELDAADLAVVVSPVLDAAEMHDGVTTLVASRAMARALPVVSLTGNSHAGRREWKALGVSTLYEPTEPLARGVSQEERLEALLERIPGIARTWSR